MGDRVKEKVEGQAWGLACGQVRIQVGNQVADQVEVQVAGQARNKAGFQVRGQVIEDIKNKK